MSGLNRRFTLAAIALPFLLLAMAGLSRAATITVTTLADPSGAPGTCSLREAITNANGQNRSGSTNCAAGSGNNDTIVFASGLTGTITLGSTLPTITDTNLAIIGPTNPPGITISGGGLVQLMEVGMGATLNVQLLTLTGGNTRFTAGPCEWGADICNQGSLTVSNCTFSDNVAPNGGGAIATGVKFGPGLTAGTLTVTNSVFSNNKASVGGAIYDYYNTLTITNSTFLNNEAVGVPLGPGFGGPGSGGALQINGGGPDSITNCMFSGNQVVPWSGGPCSECGSGNGFGEGDGGAIWEQTTGLSITDSTFSNNQSTYAGGAIENYYLLNITNSTFSGNRSNYGGAINNDSFAMSYGTLSITNSTFSGNQSIYGGAIDNEYQSTMKITNSTFSGNQATVFFAPVEDLGGAIANNGGSVYLKSSIFARSAGDNCEGMPFLNITDDGYNISDDNSCGFSGTSKNSTNPELAAGLANNGGPTETIALLAGSPALNTIPIASCTYLAGSNPCSNSSSTQLTCDQRHYPRPAPGDTACSIGAYEGFQRLCPPGERWTGFQCIAILPKCPAACRNGCIVVPPGVPPNNKPGNSTPMFACKNAQGGIGTFHQQ